MDTAKLHLENGGISFRVSMEEGISLLQKHEPPIRCLCVLAPKQHPYLTLRPCLTKHSWMIIAKHTL